MIGGNEAREITLEILAEVLGGHDGTPFAVRLWDETVWPEDAVDSPAFTLVLNHPGALREMFLPPSELNIGEAYIYGDFDVEGDLIAAFPLARTFENLDLGLGDKLGLAWKLRSLPKAAASREGRQAATVEGRTHSARDRQVISYHYDVSNDFYALWLDERMIYSCGYFADPDESIDTAQERKLDYICRKLRLQPGEKLLDIGCGWGGLIIHAAKHYGVQAVGITLSEPQVACANRRIEEEGLGDLCEVRYQDYRDVAPEEPFDKLVSVGMFEHVGEEKMRVYFEHAREILRESGLFLNHAIARPGWEPKVDDPNTFSNRYVFPDGEHRRGPGLRGARCGVAAGALCTYPPPLGAPSRGPPRESAGARGRGDLSGVAALHVGLRGWVRERSAERLPVAALQAGPGRGERAAADPGRFVRRLVPRCCGFLPTAGAAWRRADRHSQGPAGTKRVTQGVTEKAQRSTEADFAVLSHSTAHTQPRIKIGGSLVGIGARWNLKGRCWGCQRQSSELPGPRLGLPQARIGQARQPGRLPDC